MRTLGSTILLLTLVVAARLSAGQEEEKVLGTPSTIQPSELNPHTISVQPGTRIRQQPRRDSVVLEIIDLSLQLPVIERRANWVKTRYRSWQGWIELPAGESASEGVSSSLPEPDGALPERARELLATGSRTARLGPFALYTDVQDAALLDWLSAAADSVLTTYRGRYHLDPGSGFSELVLLFSAESSYRHLASEVLGTAEAFSNGYTRDGISVLFTSTDGRQETVSALVHELTHLLNRRVFGAGMPPWLDEGLAEDLAYCRVDARGRLLLGTLGGETTTAADQTRISTGPRAHLATLLAAWRSPNPPSIAQLPLLERADFLQSGSRSLHYAESAFLVRLLLDDADHRPRFLGYLGELAASELVESVSLWDALGVAAATLEPEFFRFVTAQARAYDIPPAVTVER